MAPPRRVLLPLLLLLTAAAAVLCTAAAQGYCRDSLAGLSECESFMYGGAAAPARPCCAAFEAAFNADPFCLCYVVDGTYGRAAGYDVDVARALRIPAACGLGDPPVELCNMEGLVLPPYAPDGTPAQPPAAAAADAPSAQPPAPSGSSSSPPPAVAPPTFTAPQPPTSQATRDPLPELLMLMAAILLLNI